MLLSRLTWSYWQPRLKAREKAQQDQINGVRKASAEELRVLQEAADKADAAASTRQNKLRFRMQDGRFLAAQNTTAFATSDEGRSAYVQKGFYQNRETAKWDNPLYRDAMEYTSTLNTIGKINTSLLAKQDLTKGDLRLSTQGITLKQQLNQLEKEYSAQVAQTGNHLSENLVKMNAQIQALRNKLSIQKSEER